VLSRRRALASIAGAVAAPWTGLAEARRAGGLVSADVHVDGYPTVEAVRWIAAELEKRTEGRLQLKLFHSGQLGRESDTVDLARNGVIDLTRVHISVMANAVPASRVLALPYLIESTAHLRRAVDGVPGRAVLDAMAARGLVGLAIYDGGARCIYNVRHPVTRPADLAGLKLRVPPSDLFIDMTRALGANATPLSYGETFAALQTGLIDGAENNWRSFQSSRHYESAKYWANTGHSYAPDLLLMSSRRLALLSPADQALIRELASASVAVMRQRWDVEEIRAREAVLDAGVQQTDVDVDAFRDATAMVVRRAEADTDVARLVRAVRELA
jgi:tripartite ATP-independent transporter DctP family solute receptor